MQLKQFFDSKKIAYKEESGGKELRIICPHCKNEKQKCYVNATSGNWYCHHCGYGGAFKHLTDTLKLSLSGVALELAEDKSEWNLVTPIDPEDIEEHHQRLLKALETDTGLQNYIYTKRGYTLETVKKFKLGWGRGANVIIPIVDSRDYCFNFKMKPDPTRPIPAKGMISIEGRGKKRLFNEKVLMAKTKKDTERVIICEGEWDCMLLDQMGYSAVTSTGGVKSFDESWISAFTKFDKVYVCFDNDRNGAGQEGTKKVAEMFYKKGIRVFTITLPAPTITEDNIDLTDFFTKRRKVKADFTELLKSAIEYSGKELAFEKYRFISGATLDDMEFPKNEWIIDRFIQDKGISCIAGPGGSGKSYFTTYLASCIAQGLPILNKFKTKKGNVLFVDKENALSWTQNRLRKFKIPKESLERIFFMSQGDFMIENKESVEQVEACIVGHNIDLVVIDTLIKIHSGDEISASDINRISQVFWRFQQAGAAVLFVHHFVKTSSQFPITNVVSALRGSSHIYNMVDNYFAFYVKKGILRLDMAKSRNDQLMKPFKLDCSIFGEDISYHYIGDIDEEEEESYRRASCKEMIKEFIDGPKKRHEIIDKMSTHFSKPTVERTLAEMTKLEEVEKQANGKEVMYFLSKKIRAEINGQILADF